MVGFNDGGVQHPRATCLGDLPEHRRASVAFLALRWIDNGRDVFQGWAGCQFPDPLVEVADGAGRASDGRFNLVSGEQLTCARAGTRHRQSVHWNYDPEVDSYRIQAASEEHFKYNHHLYYEWDVDHAGELTNPALVPPIRRCPIDREHWPGYIGGGRLANLRRILIDSLGPLCSLCQVRYPVVIDHDHETGLVRGYLCRDCNARVEQCLHLSGCPRAEYLNSPQHYHSACVIRARWRDVIAPTMWRCWLVPGNCSSRLSGRRRRAPTVACPVRRQPCSLKWVQSLSYATWLALGGATAPRAESRVALIVAAGVTAAELRSCARSVTSIGGPDSAVPARRGTRLSDVGLRIRRLTRDDVMDGQRTAEVDGGALIVA